MIVNKLKVVFHVLFASSDSRVSLYLKLLYLCKKHKKHFLGLIISRKLQRRYGVFITYNTSFDDSLILRHPVAIVIGDGVEIGRNVTIFQNVTLGRSDASVSAYPKIGDGTVIYSGAVVLGGINVGKNCVIGANSVVINSVPDDCIAVGVPARIIRKQDAAGFFENEVSCGGRITTMNSW